MSAKPQRTIDSLSSKGPSFSMPFPNISRNRNPYPSPADSGALRSSAKTSMATLCTDQRRDLLQSQTLLRAGPQKEAARNTSPRKQLGLSAEAAAISANSRRMPNAREPPIKFTSPTTPRTQERTLLQRPARTAPRGSRSEALSLKLDQETFRNFWPLLDESRDYARLSGCRFRSRSFDCIAAGEQQLEPSQGSAPTRPHSDDTDDRLVAARAKAAPSVYRFAQRLRAGDEGLFEELEKAFRIVMAESVRSAMLAQCQVLDLWPPSPAPEGIAKDDCAFEDVSASVPVIAQRLYNDQKRREYLTPQKGDMDPMRRRGMMASFIVEFAYAAGAPIPEMPTTYDMMLSDFKAAAAKWEEAQQSQLQQCAIASEAVIEQVCDIDAGDTEKDTRDPTGKSNKAQEEESINLSTSVWSAVMASSTIAAVLGVASATMAPGSGGSTSRMQRKSACM